MSVGRLHGARRWHAMPCIIITDTKQLHEAAVKLYGAQLKELTDVRSLL
jgi:hypothetical protein